jgi:hypothetical protein
MKRNIRRGGPTQAYLTAREIAEALKGRKVPGGWLACCPAHHDVNPSLSIADGDNGRPVFHCFAGCAWQAVLDNLIARGLMPNLRRRW